MRPVLFVLVMFVGGILLADAVFHRGDLAATSFSMAKRLAHRTGIL